MWYHLQNHINTIEPQGNMLKISSDIFLSVLDVASMLIRGIKTNKHIRRHTLLLMFAFVDWISTIFVYPFTSFLYQATLLSLSKIHVLRCHFLIPCHIVNTRETRQQRLTLSQYNENINTSNAAGTRDISPDMLKWCLINQVTTGIGNILSPEPTQLYYHLDPWE